MALTTVKAVQGNGSFENQYGTENEQGKKLLYSFEYEMEDGTIIKANHKFPEGNFKVGQSVEYEVKKEDPTHGKSGRVTKPGAGNFQGTTKPSQPFKAGVTEDLRQLMIVRQSSLNRAVEILTHNSRGVAEGVGNGWKEVDEIEAIELANSLTKWVMGEKKEEKSPEPLNFGTEEPKAQPQAVKQAIETSSIGQEPSDDLPF